MGIVTRIRGLLVRATRSLVGLIRRLLRPVADLSGERRLTVWTVLVVGWVAVTTFDATLAAMHGVGAAAGGPSAVAVPLAGLAPERAVQVVDAWASWPEDAVGLSAGWVLVGYVVTDVIAVAIPVAVLLVLGLRSASQRCSAAGATATEPGRIASRLTWVGPSLFLLADMFEDAGLSLAYCLGAGAGTPPEWALRVTGGASFVKWLALGASLAVIVFARVAARRSQPSSVPSRDRGTRPALLALRAQVAVLLLSFGLLLLLPGDIGRQVGDVVLALSGELGRTSAAVAVVAGLALFIAVTGRACIEAYKYPPAPAPPLEPKTLIWGLGGGVALLMVGWWVGKQGWPLGWLLATGGILVILLAALSLTIDREAAPVSFTQVNTDDITRSGGPTEAPQLPAADWTPTAEAMLRWVAAGSLLAFGAAAVRGVVILGTVQEWTGVAWLVVIALVSGLLAAALVSELAGGLLDRIAGRFAGWKVRWLVLAGVILLAGLVGAYPIPIGQRVGALAVLFFFFTVLLAVATTLVLLGDRHRPRGVLSFVGLRRMPYVALAFALFLGSSTFNREGRYHEVELLDEPAAQTPVAVAFNDWTERNQAKLRDGTRTYVPMVFIAAAGGGIRAAYWTSLTLDCLSGHPIADEDRAGEADPCGESALSDGFEQVFVASGVSGGSVGLAGFRATSDGDGDAHEIFESKDFLAPTLAAYAFRDVPNGFLQADDVWDDRAGVLEDAWTAAHEGLGDGLHASAEESGFPLLLLNGATVDGGCRLAASILDLSPATTGDGTPRLNCTTVGEVASPREDSVVPPGAAPRTRDAADYACSPEGHEARDLSLATAAHLSARFPFVSPSGALNSCLMKTSSGKPARTFVLDGGIIDSSGALPLAELWASMGPLVQKHNADSTKTFCIVPRLLLIDNGYVDASSQDPPQRPKELLAPASAVQSAGNSTAPAARQAAAIAIQAAAGNLSCSPYDEASDDQDASDNDSPDSSEPEVTQPERPDVTDSVAHLYPQLHPGPMAPLGWVLSSWSEEDLRTELMSERNRDQLALVRSWFNE